MPSRHGRRCRFAVSATAGVDDHQGQRPRPAAAFAEDAPVFVHDVTTRDDMLRACAALRVQCFYQYDPEKHGDGALLFGEAADRARRRWVDKRTGAEEARLQKMTQLGMRVTSFAATSCAPPREVVEAESEAWEAAESAAWSLNSGVARGKGGNRATTRRCIVPKTTTSAKRGRDEEVVGTLDFHVGARLPGELLEGSMPKSSLSTVFSTSADATPEVIGAGGVELSVENGDIDVSVAALATLSVLTDEDGAVEAALAHGIDGINPSAEGHIGSSGVSSKVGTADGNYSDEEGEGYAGGGAMGGRRGYIFNVCVAGHRRRQGIAARLLRKAHFVAAGMGVEYMYVHVERTNQGARGLYEAAGYVQESEESDWLAEKLRRPPRCLLVLNLTEFKG